MTFYERLHGSGAVPPEPKEPKKKSLDKLFEEAGVPSNHNGSTNSDDERDIITRDEPLRVPIEEPKKPRPAQKDNDLGR